MNPDDAVTLQVRNHLTAGILRFSHGWGVLDADHVVMLRPKPYEFTLQSGRHYIALLNVHRRDGETSVGWPAALHPKGQPWQADFHPGRVSTAGMGATGTSAMAFTAAYIDPEICSHFGAGERQLYPMPPFEHPLLTQMMLQLDRILAQPENYSRMYAESFSMVLLSEIMNCQAFDLSRSRRVDLRPQLKGGLANWQCKAVCDYIEKNLHQDISLAELAAIARLSPYHFCRAFTKAVGKPPHRYQMSRRIDRAKTLLADPSLSDLRCRDCHRLW